MSSEIATQAAAKAAAWVRKSIALVRTSVAGMPVFASTHAETAKLQERDETHYFLVPSTASDDFMLAERRRLPIGVSATNNLPKVRVFHLPELAVLSVLEERLLGSLIRSQATTDAVEERVAERLERIGERIDQGAEEATGGVLLIAGVVSLMNPIAGAGLALQAFLPEVGTKLLRAGTDATAEMLRAAGRSVRATVAERHARGKVSRMEPELRVDRLLRFLLTSRGSTRDLVLAEGSDVGDWIRDEDGRMCARVLCDVGAEAAHTPAAGAWLASVRERLRAFDQDFRS